MKYQQNLVLTLVFSALLSTSMVATAFTKKEISYVEQAIVIDGKEDHQWQQAQWKQLDQLMLGKDLTREDFSGQFKLLWDEDYLYILAEITDDVLFDQHADPLFKYWDDDCLEVFIDEDASGGDHQNNFNAFAYHIALDNQAVDIGQLTVTPNDNKKDNFILLNDHLNSVWRRSGEQPHKIIWEVALKVFGDKYHHPNIDGLKPLQLFQGKNIGFMLAYCDNDGSKEREHFIGSTYIAPQNGDKNLGYKTADVFDKYVLVK